MPTTLDAVSEALIEAERKIEREIGETKAMAAKAKADLEEAADLEDRAEALEEVVGVLNSFAAEKQAEVTNRVEGLVTHGLQTIFGDDLTFHVIQETKAKRVESRFVIRSTMGEEVVETGILDARGGGVGAVAGFLLRLIVTLLKPGIEPFMVLDESFAQLSAEYEPRLADFLRELVDKTKVQLVLITHSPEFEGVADTAYRFALVEGRTQTVRLK